MFMPEGNGYAPVVAAGKANDGGCGSPVLSSPPFWLSSLP
jgi:hypothetical protein